MLNGVFYGYQPVEILWKKQGGMILPEQIVSKPARWFRYSDTNELRYLTKRNMITGEPLPSYKFIVCRYHSSYANPYGESLASAIYWPVKFRHSSFRFFTTFMEKYGMPWVKVTYPLGTQEQRVQEMVSIMSTAMQDAIVAAPEEMKVEMLDMSQTSSAEIYKTFIDLCNTDISIALIGQNLTTEVSGGSYAAAKQHGQVRQEVISEDIRMVESAFDTVIQWIHELNFSGEKLPKFKLVAAPQPTLDDANTAVALTKAGVKFKDLYFENRFGLLSDEFEMGINEAMKPKVSPFGGKPGEGETDGDGASNTDVETLETTHEAKDPAKNSQTMEATAKVHGKAY
jgi:phage gp29-like protein